MARLGFPIVSLFLLSVFLAAPQVQGQQPTQPNYNSPWQASIVRFNDAGEPNTGTYRILLGVQEAWSYTTTTTTPDPEGGDDIITTTTHDVNGVHWTTANTFAENYFNYGAGFELSNHPLFKGLLGLPAAPQWTGLANIESQAKNNAVRQMAQARPTSWWFGMYRIDEDIESVTVSNWTRTRDRTVTWEEMYRNGHSNSYFGPYTNWGGADDGGEPNGRSEWAGMFYSDGSWNDADGASNHWYLMEIDLGTSQGLFEVDRSVTRLVLNPANGTYYLRAPDDMTWSAAKVYAEMRSVNGVQGRLPMVQDAMLNNFLASMDGGWIGLTDSPAFDGYESGDGSVSLEDRRTSPGWKWSTPNGPAVSISSTDFLPWGNNEPNGGTGENFVQLYNNGYWNDASADSRSRPLVEFAGLEVPRNILVEQINNIVQEGDRHVVPSAFRNKYTTETPIAASGYYAAINFGDLYGINSSHAAGGLAETGYAPYPGDTPFSDDNFFLIRAKTRIHIPEAGTYVFGSHHDDDIWLFFDTGNSAGQMFSQGGAATNTWEVTFSAPGYYYLTMFQYEYGGGAGVDLIAMKKEGDTSYDYGQLLAAGAQLVGDTLNGGLATKIGPFGLDLATFYTGFTVQQVPSSVAPENYAQMKEIFDNAGSVTTRTGLDNINFGSGYDGQFGKDLSLPDDSGDYSVLLAAATLVVPETGWYTFGVTSNTGFTLDILGEEFSGDRLWGTEVVDGVLCGLGGDYHGGSIFLEEGLYNMVFNFWENNSGYNTELWWAAGRWEAFNDSFQLLEKGELPEPGTWAMMLLGAAGFALVLRRKKG